MPFSAPGQRLKETKQEVNLVATELVGVVAKRVSPSMMNTPSKVAEYTIDKIRSAVAAKKLPAQWATPCVMRVGKGATVSGVVTLALPIDFDPMSSGWRR